MDRRGRRTRRGYDATVLAWVAVLGGTLVACGGDEGPERYATTGALSDLEATDGGGLLAAERLTGRILALDGDGGVDEVAQVEVVAEPGQRGLLGIVADGGDTYASYTRAEDGRLVVAQVAPGDERLVWLGPESADLANGGRLALDGDGLVIGIGDLTEPDLVDDLDAPNGKLLGLDPQGEADQAPEVISSGWNNPFAFTIADDGSIRVADNSPGGVPERLARGDTPRPSEVVELEGQAAPSGVLSDGADLLVCGYVSEELRRYRPGSPEPEVVAEGCRYDVARLGDGRLVLADDDGVVVVDAP